MLVRTAKQESRFRPNKLLSYYFHLHGGGEIQEMVLSTLIFVVVKCRKASFQNFKYFVEKPNVKCRGGVCLEMLRSRNTLFLFFLNGNPQTKLYSMVGSKTLLLYLNIFSQCLYSTLK